MFSKSSVAALMLTYLATCYAAILTEKIPEAIEKDTLLGSFPDSSSSCGGLLSASTGIISYKQFDAVQPNERCVWTVRRPNATSYAVSISSLGIPSSVIISGFKRAGVVNHTIPTTTGSIGTTVATSNILVITFYSGPTNNTSNSLGFSLTYSSAASIPDQWISSTSEDVIGVAGLGHIKYPSASKIYNNYELSTFVLTPVPSVDGKFKNSKLIYIRDGLEGTGCADKLIIYVFDINISGGNKWKLLGNICGQLVSQLISNRDLILGLFHSDGSQTYEGFNLYSLVES